MATEPTGNLIDLASDGLRSGHLRPQVKLACEASFTKNKSPVAIIFRSATMFFSREFVDATVSF